MADDKGIANYPPELDEDAFNELVSQVKDWQISHGNCLKLVGYEEPHTVPARPLGAALFPSFFPRSQFDKAWELHVPFNRLYTRVGSDEEFLHRVLSDVLAIDPLAATLWSIHQGIRENGGYKQDLALGLFRSDYMLDLDLQLKQVEFNTVAVVGASHAQNMSRMHRHLARCSPSVGVDPHELPANNVVEGIVKALEDAHNAYGPIKSAIAKAKAILMIVQPNNVNVCDERPLEYALWDCEASVEVYRVEFGEPLLSRCRLGEKNELLFQHGNGWVEISVAYLRAGYEVNEYDEHGVQARKLVARSCAINCPTILTHLATFKLVQQALGSRDVLSNFLDNADDVDAVADTFMDMYVLNETDIGRHAETLATSGGTSRDYVLKPSMEGGGHNIYGDDIPDLLGQLPQHLWRKYILMEKIKSPKLNNMLISPKATYHGETVSELGIFSSCLWQQPKAGNHESNDAVDSSSHAGWSLKTKPANEPEMSVVKSYGHFACLRLMDDNV